MCFQSRTVDFVLQIAKCRVVWHVSNTEMSWKMINDDERKQVKILVRFY